MQETRNKKRAEPKRRARVEALVKASDPSKIVAWFCTHCGTVHREKDAAERCSMTEECTEWVCEDCGKKCHAYQWICTTCRHARWNRKESARLKKAAKVISAKDYPDDKPIVHEGEYFDCIDDLFEHCEENDVEIPDRVWATRPIKIKLDLEFILEQAMNDFPEEVSCKVVGRKELEQAVHVFNEHQTAQYYEEDNTTAVDLTIFKNSTKTGAKSGSLEGTC